MMEDSWLSQTKTKLNALKGIMFSVSLLISRDAEKNCIMNFLHLELDYFLCLPFQILSSLLEEAWVERPD